MFYDIIYTHWRGYNAKYTIKWRNIFKKEFNLPAAIPVVNSPFIKVYKIDFSNKPKKIEYSEDFYFSIITEKGIVMINNKQGSERDIALYKNAYQMKKDFISLVEFLETSTYIGRLMCPVNAQTKLCLNTNGNQECYLIYLKDNIGLIRKIDKDTNKETYEIINPNKHPNFIMNLYKSEKRFDDNKDKIYQKINRQLIDRLKE